MKKEKITNKTLDEAVAAELGKAADSDNFAEPTVIRLEANDSERVNKYLDDDEGNERKSTLRKRPSDDALLKMSARQRSRSRPIPSAISGSPRKKQRNTASLTRSSISAKQGKVFVP